LNNGDKVKIIGKLSSDLTIEYLEHYIVDIDLDILNQAIPLMYNNREISQYYIDSAQY
jgi:hypothetical protein